MNHVDFWLCICLAKTNIIMAIFQTSVIFLLLAGLTLPLDTTTNETSIRCCAPLTCPKWVRHKKRTSRCTTQAFGKGTRTTLFPSPTSSFVVHIGPDVPIDITSTLSRHGHVAVNCRESRHSQFWLFTDYPFRLSRSFGFWLGCMVDKHDMQRPKSFRTFCSLCGMLCMVLLCRLRTKHRL